MDTYCQTVNYLLAAYATDEVIAEAEIEITYIKQPEPIFAFRYLELS